MSQKLIINDTEYDFVNVGFHRSYAINDRDSATITMNKTHDEMVELFPDGVVWKIKTISDGNAEPVSTIEDCSAYCITGKIVDERDGNSKITMSKMTELERMIEIIYGGVNA